jgi:hypothetical protein
MKKSIKSRKSQKAHFKIKMKDLHIAELIVLGAGTLFAWFSAAKEFWSPATCTGSCIIGIPTCVLGAVFFTVALIVSLAQYMARHESK